ncbi:cilia- and flagella-associated protein 47-like [Eucyclogobius newberryi]|uniref:cilia- and flagella-associated protein 47-like n=1 Tax=Eucyclogobius newberryi TaxID=166745 RepID=UPI003B5CE82C
MADECVRVEPAVIKFFDVQVGHVYTTKVTATNVGKRLKKIIFQTPSSKFKFTQSRSDTMVVPGLYVSGLLEFSPEKEEHVRSALMIHTDNGTIEVPILAFPVVCCLRMNPVVDFGVVAAISQILYKQHSITNRGSAPGWFQVQDSSDPSIKIRPRDGVLASGATQWITVELRTDTMRDIYEDVIVELQNYAPGILNIRAKVVDHRLEIYDLQGVPLPCLWFGPAYFGTSCVESVVLRNNAPQACDWVCVLQASAPGTEMGTDLQRSTTLDTTLLEKMQKCSLYSPDVFECFPTHGRLEAYDQTTLTLCFSPGCKRSDSEKDCSSSSRRQDFSLFLLFESVGSKHGFTHHNGSTGVELAVTGSGVPVSLVPSPSQKLNFLPCVTGECVDLLCVLQNLCPQLPVHFRLKKLPHFSAKPSAGTIAPGQCKNIVISFSPRQQGTFQVLQKIDVLGQVRQQRGSNHNDEFEGLQLRTFHTIVLHLSAVCCSRTTHPVPQLNPGITPLVTNPTGLQPYVRLSDISRCRELVPAVVLSADKTKLHKHRRKKTVISGNQEFVAFPNDRAQSLKPPTPHTDFRTIFTDVSRHCYVDTSYAFTQQEEEKINKNLQMYSDLLCQRRQRRQQKLQQKQQEKTENNVDIGIEPSQGLVPPKLLCKDLDQRSTSFIKSWSQNNWNGRSNITPIKYKITKEVSGSINAVPSTSQEVAECNRTLNVQELYQVIIGPLSVDFGEVCVRSVCSQNLEMINHLSVHIWIQLEVDCPELQGSSPVSYVLPPHSQAALTMKFQSTELGEFYRTVPYIVNQKHPGQILVQAEVVPVDLELSTGQLVLHPISTLLACSGYRSSVTLKNHRNHPAEFTWKPVITDSGTQFSIRPATGVVDAYKELDCEVVWHASFSSPIEGDFDLSVCEGNTQHLHCEAKVGCTTVKLIDKKRVTFESVPLNLTSVRTAVLCNTGANHAFYQVKDVCPLPGMVVSPAEGMVQRGGQAVLSIHFNPDSVIRFDATVEIALKCLKSIELRVGGSVEPPNVEITRSSFQLFGVYLGSRRSVPFTLTNHSSAPARVTFDLFDYIDFSVQSTELLAVSEPGVSVVELQRNQNVNCFLVFCPTQVASYDFEIPMTVNGMVVSSTLKFSLPPSPSTFSTSCTLTSGSTKATIQAVPLSVSIVTGSRCIEATVVQPPIHMSPDSLLFDMTSMPKICSKTVELKAEMGENISWKSSVQLEISWWFDCFAAGLCMIDGEESVCTVSPSSGRLKPGQSTSVEVRIRSARFQRVANLTLPLYLGDKRQGAIRDHEERYRELSVTVHPLPHITVHPPQLLLTPVPLGCNMTVTLTVVATGYTSGTHITAEVGDVEQENGRKQHALSLTFPQGTQIPAQVQNKNSTGITEKDTASLICNVCFCSDTPLTLSSTIIFQDHFLNRFQVKVWAVADNCLLTVWPYVALHRSEQQIVLKKGATAVEAILQNFHLPSVGSFSSASTFGLSGSLKKLSDADSFPESIGTSYHSSSEEGSSYSKGTPTNCGVPEFYTSNSELGHFHQSVLVAVEKWFSLFGWANGPYPISVPLNVRRVESKIQTNNGNRKAPNKGFRSVVDMLIHLTGKEVPGIPHIQSISDDLKKRTLQFIQLYKAILEFLNVQGACLSYIRPEYLLDKREFMYWCSSQEASANRDYSSINYESMSKRSWMDLLLQIYKVFILCRVSCKDLTCNSKDPSTGEVAPSCLQPATASNIYSLFELQLLSWLNMHYESMRKTVWTADATPPARWIVNFDLDFTDGLVLAALLAAYCPYLICSHFRRMYTKPTSMEEILHNNIIVVQALTSLALNIDIYPTDLSDPNPVQLLMLCVHLNKKLPQYQPTQTITLSGELHSTIRKQVKLIIPTARPIKYNALLLGEDSHLFSLPEGSFFTLSAKESSDLTIQYTCAFLRPKEAALLLVSSSKFGVHGTLAFHLKTCVTHITPMKTVKCSSPCYKLKSIQLTVTNPFKSDGNFKVTLVDSANNPLKSEKPYQCQHTTCNPNPLVEKMTEGKLSDPNNEEDTEFLCAVNSVFLKSGQEHSLNIDYLPFSLGSRYCCVLLLCPQVGEIVYMVKAVPDFPQPMTLSAKPSEHIKSSADTCVSVLSLQCKAGDVCREVICLPIINMAWEQALATWGQHKMSAEEHRRRSLTHTLHSSSVRRATALHKLGKQRESENGIMYSMEVSLPQYFKLPKTVTIPVNESLKMPWENPADCRCVEIPLCFQAHSVGTFTCKMVLRSWCDTRVYMLEAMVTTQEKSAHLDFTTPAHHSVMQYIPLHNDSEKDLKMKATVCGYGFSGPDVFNVAAATKACYPLTFHPATQHIVMGKLTLHNECNGTEHMFTLRGVGEHPLPEDNLLLRCPVGRSTEAHLNVPNYSKTKLQLKVKTDIPMISGPKYLDIKPGQTVQYTLIISPSKRGTQKGCVSFVESPKQSEEDRYKVYFNLEIICEAAEPLKNIDILCPIQSNVTIEIPINNPCEDQLDLVVFLEGHGLIGDKSFSLPPQMTLNYKVIFSPNVIGMSTGSVVFQSEIGDEFWYQLELYGLPVPVVVLPKVKCQLGKSTKITLPLVNPYSEPVELTVSNSNPENYTLEMDSNNLTLQPHSSSQLGVHFSPSSVVDRDLKAVITFSCPQMPQWSFSLSGCALNPKCKKPKSISSKMGSSTSINIPFNNPTERQAVLHATLTDEHPNQNQNYSGGFAVPISLLKGVPIDAGSSIDVPVVFTPTSMKIEKAQLCITLEFTGNLGISSLCNAHSHRSDQDWSTICWIYPLFGIATEVPVVSPPLGLIQCEEGCQLEKKVDVLLAGCVLGNQEVIKEDFLCEVHSELEVEESLCATVDTARRDPDSGTVKLTLHLLYRPLEPCRTQ